MEILINPHIVNRRLNESKLCMIHKAFFKYKKQFCFINIYTIMILISFFSELNKFFDNF